MEQIHSSLKERISGKKCILLFTGNRESTVILNILQDMNCKVLFIDTECHFDEIIDYVNDNENKIQIFLGNDFSVHPSNDSTSCCNQRKADILKKYLEKAHTQCLVVPFRDEEKENGIEDSYLKGIEDIEIIRPLADVTERDLWITIKENHLHFSAIYNKGFRFVDCKCCTTRYGIKRHTEDIKTGEDNLDSETQEKLKALGYM